MCARLCWCRGVRPVRGISRRLLMPWIGRLLLDFHRARLPYPRLWMWNLLDLSRLRSGLLDSLCQSLRRQAWRTCCRGAGVGIWGRRRWLIELAGLHVHGNDGSRVNVVSALVAQTDPHLSFVEETHCFTTIMNDGVRRRRWIGLLKNSLCRARTPIEIRRRFRGNQRCTGTARLCGTITNTIGVASRGCCGADRCCRRYTRRCCNRRRGMLGKSGSCTEREKNRYRNRLEEFHDALRLIEPFGT